MPFDALIAPAAPKPLALLLEEHDIAPVPLQALASHCQAQLDRFAPSFWYRHQTWLPVGLIGSVGCMAASGGLSHAMMSDPLPSSWLSLGWLSVMALLILFGVFRVSAGARWEERWVGLDELRRAGVPEPIASRARLLLRAAPGAALILGELKQEEVVLDPYLLFERDGERVCLGIWDDRQIIAL